MKFELVKFQYLVSELRIRVDGSFEVLVCYQQLWVLENKLSRNTSSLESSVTLEWHNFGLSAIFKHTSIETSAAHGGLML